MCQDVVISSQNENLFFVSTKGLVSGNFSTSTVPFCGFCDKWWRF
ncbi:unnamed protein product [Tuber melanosporum]|uniref:(Perigord truffle) hypothetical protein n=1 Tax=Tuber melanosporum (strain Mel28) TaxID=656061 RepID=D5G8X8_TUBMM|nr:uncharacterized protein GSTUM_00004889001 [Tuber melanosporum]CAZ80971.1 unnamed protein product [Tuber melanosporum]